MIAFGAENMNNAKLNRYMAGKGFEQTGELSIPVSDDFSSDISSDMPSSSLAGKVHQLFSCFVAPLLYRTYNTLKPAMVPNWFMPPDVVTLTDKRLALYHAAMRQVNQSPEQINHIREQVNQLRGKQSPASKLRVFWDSFSERPAVSSSSAASSVIQFETTTRALAPVLEEQLAEQFLNTPEPDYALWHGETLIVQLKPESADHYFSLLENQATITPVAEDHHVYRLSGVHLTTQGLAELKKAAAFTLLVDDRIKACYNTSTGVVHFDTGLRAAFGRALAGAFAGLAGGRKTTKDHYVVQPQNGSTQKLLDTIQEYELPLHAIDLRNGFFVFDGRYRLPPALLNSSVDQSVIPTSVYGSGIYIHELHMHNIARRAGETRNASQTSPN